MKLSLYGCIFLIVFALIGGCQSSENTSVKRNRHPQQSLSQRLHLRQRPTTIAEQRINALGDSLKRHRLINVLLR